VDTPGLHANLHSGKAQPVTMRRWDPLRDLLNLQERMNRLFDESLSRGRLEDPKPSPTWTPLADVYEAPETYVVQMELPGLLAEDVEIRVKESRVVVKGVRRLAASTRPDSFHRMERSYGPFERSFVFPDEVDADSVTAVFEGGILRLELQKARGSVQRIRVERAE
jgi:HSP20 family protein